MPKLVVNLYFFKTTCISKKNLLKYICKKERKNMSKQIIYHGSYCEVKEPRIIKGIVFCTENALKCIKFIGAEEIENGTTKK